MAKLLRPDFIGSTPVIPVITIHQLEHAVPLARALVAGGLRILELTLRTPVALEALAAMVREVPEAIVGAGTVLRADQIDAVAAVGGRFCVSPGSTDAVLARACERGMPMLPGAVTASELMALMEWGVSLVKFFPAENHGGAAALKTLGGPFGELSFCPTGGIDLAKAPNYLSLPNVVCVGGAWITPPDLLESKNWDEIEARARQAAALR